MSTMNGERWYKTFRERFNPETDKAVARMWKPAEVEARKWTTLMVEFLKAMAHGLNFETTNEKQAVFGKRFDMKWKDKGSNGYEIFLEHENDPSACLEEEAEKLLDACGDLKVLITYVPKSEFPGNELAEQLLKRVAVRGRGSEFLLVVGTADMESPWDWCAHHIYKEYTSRTLIIPPGVLHRVK